MSGRTALPRSPDADGEASWGGLKVVLAAISGIGFLLYCLALLFDWIPGLRGWGNYPEGWTWPTYPFPPLRRFIAPLVAVVLIWIVSAITDISQRARHAAGFRGSRTVKATYLVLLLALGYVLQLGLLGLKAENPNALLVQRVTNRVFTGYFNLAASATDVSTFFSKYPDVFSSKTCPHCHSHPPGPALFYWLNIKAVELLPLPAQNRATAGVQAILGPDQAIQDVEKSLTDAQLLGAFLGGSMVLLLATAVIFPLFGLARLLGPPGDEYKLAALGLALPGLVLMAPQFDQILATVSAVVLYLAVRGLLAPTAVGAALWSFASGATIALGIFFSWSQASLLAVVVALGLATVVGSRQMLVSVGVGEPAFTAANWLTAAVAAFVGIIVPLVLLGVLTGIDLPYIFNYNLGNEVLAEAKRPYSVWIIHGPIDFLQFFGLPLAVAVAISVIVPPWGIRGASRVTPPIYTEEIDKAKPVLSRVNIYATLFWLGLLAIDLAGKSKAEQGRLLIFLMPLGLCGLYMWFGRARKPSSLVTVLFFAQIVVTIIIGARWMVP